MEKLYYDILFETRMASFELVFLLKQYGIINAYMKAKTEHEVIMTCVSSKVIIDDFKEQIDRIICDFTPDITNIHVSARAKDETYQVSKIILPDGSIYSGDVIDRNGEPIPNGFGKRKYSLANSVNGFYSNGFQNGACYVNNHSSMILCNFRNGVPYGWGMSVDANGVQFGVIMNDDYTICLNNHLSWIIELLDGKTNIKGGLITYFREAGEILYGYREKDTNGHYYLVKGVHFMKNGDVYCGTDSIDLSKTGFFVKYNHEGYIEIGSFKNGLLQRTMTIQELLKRYWPNSYSDKNIGNRHHALIQKLLDIEIDPQKKYF